jgi:sugar/nucleoside kinase (ribokinase family)
MNGAALNPALCVTGFVFFEVRVPTTPAEIQPGREVFVDELPVRLGGALNTSSVAAALGVDVVLVHPAGDGLTDLSTSYFTLLLGVPCQKFDARPDPAISIVYHSEEDRSFLTSADYQALGGCPDLPPARWIHVPGLVEARLLRHRLREARSRGSRISVSGSWAPMELEQLRLIDDDPWDLLVLNSDEAFYAAGGGEGSMEEISDAARNIIVTDSEAGAFGVIEGEFLSVPPVKADSSDTTGAGDAFCAGFLAAEINGLSPRDSMEMAVQTASRKIQYPGGVPVDLRIYDDLRAHLATMRGEER